MKHTIEDILKLKKHKNNLGKNGYDWFFMDLENNYISKTDGTKRNGSILERYDKDAKAYIIHQLFYINEDAANALVRELGLDEPYVSDENYKYIIKPRNN